MINSTPCRRAERLMQDNLDGMLTQKQRAELDRHCSQCHACTAARAQYAALHREVSRWTGAPVPEHSVDIDALFAVIDAQPEESPASSPAAWGLSWAGAGCAVAAWGAWIMQRQPQWVHALRQPVLPQPPSAQTALHAATQSTAGFADQWTHVLHAFTAGIARSEWVYPAIAILVAVNALLVRQASAQKAAA